MRLSRHLPRPHTSLRTLPSISPILEGLTPSVVLYIWLVELLLLSRLVAVIVTVVIVFFYIEVVRNLVVEEVVGGEAVDHPYGRCEKTYG